MLPWYLFALAAAACIVIRDLASKKALHDEHSLEMLVARALFLIPLLLILGFFIPIGLPLGTLPLLYIVSVLATGGILLRTKGLRHLDVSVASPLQNVSPLFLLLLATLFLGERPGPIQLLGILLVILGAYLLEGGKEHPGLLGPWRHLWLDRYAWLPIGAGLVLSVSQTMDKFLIGAGIRPLVYLFWVWLFINVNFLLVHLARFRWRGLHTNMVRDWRWLAIAAFALFCQMLSYYNAVERGLVTLVIPITRMSALGLVLFGSRIYHEESLGRRLGAGAIMLLGAVLILL